MRKLIGWIMFLLAIGSVIGMVIWTAGLVDAAIIFGSAATLAFLVIGGLKLIFGE